MKITLIYIFFCFVVNFIYRNFLIFYMENANSFLRDWAVRFLENKDSVRKEIIKIEKDAEDSDFVVNYKDKVNYFFIRLQIDSGIFAKIIADRNYGIFALNNMSNIRFVASEWKTLSDFKFLSIYFSNPFSSMDKVWTINPHIHNKICDLSSLELGLRAMAELVVPIGIGEFRSNVKLN